VSVPLSLLDRDRVTPSAAGLPPRVSVGMPVYNASRTIVAAARCILDQTFRDLELVICDNASTDDTIAICQQLAERDNRVRVLRNDHNVGINGNYQRVADAARGEFFKWASSNDLVDPNFIAECVRALDLHPESVLAYGQTVLYTVAPAVGESYDDNLRLDDDDPAERFRRCLHNLQLNNVSNGLIRRSALRQTGTRPRFRSADGVFLAHLALLGKFTPVPTTRFYRCMDPTATTRHQSSDAVLRVHYPEGGWARLFQDWKLMLGYWRAVLKTPLRPGVKMHALTTVARFTYWQVPRLGHDLVEALAHFRDVLGRSADAPER
jgi:glycosyltransferase involved in cell wall biosynthesis